MGVAPLRSPPAAAVVLCLCPGLSSRFQPSAPPASWSGPELPAEKRRQGGNWALLPEARGQQNACPRVPADVCVGARARWCRTGSWGGDGERFSSPGLGGAEKAPGSSTSRFALPIPVSPPQASEGTRDSGPCGRAGSGVCFPFGVGGREKKIEKQQPPAFPFL